MKIDAGAHFGPWVVVAPHAQGGTGTVYLGFDSRRGSGATCAIKVLALESEERRRRFETEAQASAKLRHAHICRLLDVGVQGDVGYLVMPYLDGETLAARLRAGPLSIPQVLRLGAELASALAHAHAQGVLHRDVKPANVMLGESGAILLDFGLAAVGRAQTGATIADWAAGHPGAGEDPATLPAGTLYYMAPEQLTGGTLDARTDLFGLGAVLYECLTGRRAFEAASSQDCINRTLRDEPVPLATVRAETPKRLQLVVEQCLAKQAAARPADAADVAGSLEELASSWTWRRRASVGAGAVVAALLLGSMAISYHDADPRVVVLPCRAENALDADEALCRGLMAMTTTKLHHLSRSGHLQVVSALEVRENAITTLDEARTAFGATVVVACTLSNRAPEQHVSCELVDTATRKQLDAYDSAINPTVPLAVQDHMVQWVVGALRLKLGARSADPPLAARSAAQHEANALYLQGQGHLLGYHDPANLGKAELALTAALTRDPNMTEASAALARTYLAQFRSGHDPALFERARTICERASSRDPTNADGQLCLADLYAQRGQYLQALTYYRQALDLNPAIDEAYLGQAHCEEELKRTDEAQRTYELYIKAHPAYWGGYKSLAEFFRRRGDYDRALKLWLKVVEMIPMSPAAHASLAAVYTYDGQYEQALRAFTRSWQLRDDFSVAFNLGSLLVRLRRYEDAIRVLEEANALHAPTCQTVGGLARAYQGAGRRDRALQLYREAVRLGTREVAVNPAGLDLHLLLAAYNSQLGHVEEVQHHLTAAHVVEGDPLCPTNSHDLLYAVIAYETIGDRKSATMWLDKARERGLKQAEVKGWFELDAIRADTQTKH